MAKDDELLSVPEVARLAEVSEREVREAIRQEVLPAEKVGASWAIRKDDAEDWVDELDDEEDEDDADDDDEYDEDDEGDSDKE